jgi:cellulose synthase/poly-beta-1,6-N-acetylglucosamine synthase-like glycosyltransferase
MMAMELAGLMIITGAGYVNKWHHLANGTNMGFRKDQFDVLGGYRGSEKYASGDDMFLMNKYKIRYPKATGFLKSKGAIVNTEAPQNFLDFFQQRIRWSTKNKSFPDTGMKAVLILMFFTSLLIPLNIILAVWGGFTFLIIAIIGLVIKSVADYHLISTGAKYFDIKGWRKIFLPSELFQVFYVIIIGVASLFKSKFTWKERSVQ